MMKNFVEYEFTLPDGSLRYEFAASFREVMLFKKMHGALKAAPVRMQPVSNL